MSRGDKRIDEELVSIDSLVHFLTGSPGSSSVEALEEPDDPPDFWLSVDGGRFAVEVTSIITAYGYAALCNSLHISIKDQFSSDVSATGTYALVVHRRPNVPKRSSRDWRALVEASIASIKALANSSCGTEMTLQQDQRGRLSIVKWSDLGRTIGLCQSSEAKWQREAQNELSLLLKDAIEKKHRKLNKKGILAICPDVILLLYDAYGYAGIEDARQALSDIVGYNWLHSIFWASSFSKRTNILYPNSPGRSGAFLYSKNDGWMALPV